MFARYSLAGSLAAAFGALAVGVPEWLARAHRAGAMVDALRGMFVLLRRRSAWRSGPCTGACPCRAGAAPERAPTPLGPSRGIVVKLAALFSVDAFAGGLVLNSLVSLWLMQRFGLIAGRGGRLLLLEPACSPRRRNWLRRAGTAHRLAQHDGLHPHPGQRVPDRRGTGTDTAAGAGLLLVRALLSQMDVPTRTAYVMSVVTPAERAAAASFTTVPRSLAAAASPALAGALFAAGWLATPLLLCGVLKIGYDLTLWRACRRQPLQGD